MKRKNINLGKYLLAMVTIGTLIMLGACSGSPSSITTPVSTTPATTATPAGGILVTINLIAQNMAFDKNTITVPAGASITINFNNLDIASHNFALYTNASATPPAIFRGPTISASTTIYTFKAPPTPGTYFFRCDFHPMTMTGSLIVE